MQGLVQTASSFPETMLDSSQQMSRIYAEDADNKVVADEDRHKFNESFCVSFYILTSYHL